VRSQLPVGLQLSSKRKKKKGDDSLRSRGEEGGLTWEWRSAAKGVGQA